VNRKQYDHISEQELLESFYSDRNNEWLGILLQRYTLLLFGVCMKYLKNEEEARDAVQQIFLKVITELQRYKVEYFKSWLYMVAKNHCLMKIRATQGKRETELKEEITGPAEDGDHISSIREKDVTLNLMNESLEELNKEQKDCVTLFYLEKRSYQEITESTGLSMMQVKSHIQNGKRNLRIILEKKLKIRGTR
jgi:RNA polymerase sigma-70 factor (ECF subfamily)